MKIILFDDHELFAKSLEISLKDQITSFETYVSPENIVQIVSEKKPDMLLMDIHMGEFNGLHVSRELLVTFPELKIVFLSGYDLLEYHNEAIKMGAKGFINKNVSLNDLLAKINLVLGGATIFPKYEQESEPLTNREKEVLQLAAKGMKQQEIANQLYISRRTVNNHIQTINEKFYVNSTVAAIVRGIQLGIVQV
ncbi:response regulator transcription factor [Enterococcus sp. LJL99]